MKHYRCPCCSSIASAAVLDASEGECPECDEVHPSSEWKAVNSKEKGWHYECPRCSFIVTAEERDTPYIETECPRCAECYPDWVRIEGGLP
jgi:phage FluMu protein Com